ncbi:hypothetical protein JAG28_003491 [Citrobacter werkmanii]|nr:hypothetical protein [Citrobacter werkmanii]
MSESSHELAQLSFLVQVEKAACVTFPLCAVKVTHWTGAGLKHCISGAVLRSRGSNHLTAMQAAARQVKSAENQQVLTDRENSGMVQIQASILAQ